MEEYNDKDTTIEFRPQKEEKEYVNRENDTVYGEARRSSYSSREKESSNRPLIYLALVLAILLVIAVTVGIWVLSSTNSKNNEELSHSQENTQNIIEEEEENPPIEEEIINFYNVVFYGDSVIKTQDGYSVLADLYDDAFVKKDNRKLYITEETDIRENGKRLSASGLVYAIESMAGEGVVFEAKIRENDNMVISVSYEGSFEEEMNPPQEETPSQDGEEIPPSQEIGDGEEPIIGENQTGEAVE